MHRATCTQLLQLVKKNAANHLRAVQTAALPPAAPAPPKPFFFQDILEQEKKHDVTWKKLTGFYINANFDPS